MAARYWTSHDWMFAWSALVVLLAIQFGTVYVLTWGVTWQQQFYDALERRQAALFAQLTVLFAVILLSQVALTLVNSYFTKILGLRWRTYLTDIYLGRWMARERFYEIERRSMIDNPDQRIAEDIEVLTGQVPGTALSIVTELTTAVSFAYILMETARTVRFPVFGLSMALPADLLVYAVLYAAVGTVLIVVIGRPYVTRNRMQQQYEADFRAGMMALRRDAEPIALAGAQPIERRSLANRFATVRSNYKRVILATIGLEIGNGGYNSLGSVIPLFVLVPRFFAGEISLGQIIAGRSAFGTLTGSLAFLVNSYSLFGLQVASILRLRALDDALDQDRSRGIGFAAGAMQDRGVAVRTADLRIARPDGRELLQMPDWTVRTGERWVIRGDSGAGKSTLLRAIAGLWPDGAGTVSLCDDCNVMFVPQRLYLPLGSLKDAICFPDPGDTHDDAAIATLLNNVGLGEHVDRMGERRMWQDELSPGEQQRIAQARILLHRPDVLVLDEATSALDQPNAQQFYRAILGVRPDLTLISVVHDDRLVPFHTHGLTIEAGSATCVALAEDGA